MNTDSISRYIEKNLSEKRKAHIEGVRKTAAALAVQYGEDPEKAEAAALFHDMYRGVSAEVLNYYVRHLNLDQKYMNNPNLAHGKIAAIIMERDYGIADQDMINAVSFHTTGRAKMSLLEKIIYIADAIEPGRRYPGVDVLREAAARDLDEACLLSLTRTIDYVRNQGSYLDTDTIEARDFLLKQKEEEGQK